MKDVETYAFIDPGSMVSFCTEELQRILKLKGKSTHLFLNTVGQDKADNYELMKRCVLSDLGVCGSLKEVCLPCIKAEVDLLIDTNIKKSLSHADHK